MLVFSSLGMFMLYPRLIALTPHLLPSFRIAIQHPELEGHILDI